MSHHQRGSYYMGIIPPNPQGNCWKENKHYNHDRIVAETMRKIERIESKGGEFE